MTNFRRFLREEDGAITVDWLPLTFGVMISGIITLFAIFANGVGPMTAASDALLKSVVSDLEPGPVPDLNKP